MKKLLAYTAFLLIAGQSVFALDTVFDSMDKATEVKLAPAVKSSNTNTAKTNTTAATSTKKINNSIKEEKFNNALVNLDDAQVELRQELATVTSKYNVAIQEKEKAVANCKSLKKEINTINKKMKNVEKSKKIINKNLGNEK
jgi:hypothetical protein